MQGTAIPTPVRPAVETLGLVRPDAAPPPTPPPAPSSPHKQWGQPPATWFHDGEGQLCDVLGQPVPASVFDGLGLAAGARADAGEAGTLPRCAAPRLLFEFPVLSRTKNAL